MSFLPPYVGWLSRGFAAWPGTGHGLTQHRCGFDRLEVGMSAVAFLLPAKGKRPRLTVVIGIDPHKSSHTAAALDPDSHAVLDTVRMEATLVDYRRLLGCAKRFGQRRCELPTCM